MIKIADKKQGVGMRNLLHRMCSMQGHCHRWLLGLTGVAVLFAGASLASAFNSLPQVEPSDLYRARQLQIYTLTNDLAMDRFGKPWVFGEKEKCNFTYFSPEAKDVTFGGKGLSFKTSGDKIVAGWGNYDGRQAKAERIMMYSGWNEIELRIRQSAASSVWKVDLWADGKTKAGVYSHEQITWAHQPSKELTVNGTDWQTLRFRMYKPGADGFGLTIKGPEGNAVEIESFKVVRSLSQGYYRKEFVLPEGKIWRAVGEISMGISLKVNGKDIPVRSVYETTAPVDLTPYLEPGKKNVVCLSAKQSVTAVIAPTIYFQGRVVMSGGEVVTLDADTSWIGNALECKDWGTPGFDAAAWKPASVSTPTLLLGSAIRRWPAYDGRILLENPGKDPRLYFDDAESARVNARLPEGLEKDKASLRWILRRVERGSERPEVGRGSVAQAGLNKENRSIVYSLDLGKRTDGVYTLETELAVGDKVLERRLEEPLIVVGRLPMKEVSGSSYEEGMELELEDVIDFTDADDPHRWVESVPRGGGVATQGIKEPKIVSKAGMVYREMTDPALAAMFSYRFEFRDPNSWYLMVLEYPNDAERWIGVSVTSTGRERGTQPLAPWRRLEAGWTSEDGPSLVTGDKYPLDGKMHEMRWLHWADPEIHTLDIVNLRKGLHAAAARLKIYHVKQLPAMSVKVTGERFFGIHTERARSLGRTFSDGDGIDGYQMRYDALQLDMVGRFTQRLRWHFDACRNYTEYLRFTGQNLHVMGSFQYAENNNPYTPPDMMPGDGRVLQDIRETALRFFERNGITMYSMVEYIGHTDLKAKYAVGDAEVGAGADTISFVNKDGKQGGWIVNPNHPASEAGYLRVVGDLAAKFSFSPAWKGIYYCIAPDKGSFGPGPCIENNAPFDYDYSDATIAAFEKETGVKVPGEKTDPKRFGMRYLFLTSDAMREQWVQWRGLAMRSYMTKTLAVLQKYRPDLNVLYGFHTASAMSRYWLYESGKSYKDYFREMGMDPSVVKSDKNIWFGRYIYPTGPASNGGMPYFWEHIVGKEPIAYYDVGQNRMVVLATCWHELPTCAPGWKPTAKSDSTDAGAGKIENIQPPDWPMPANVSRFISQAHGDNVLEPYTQAMIGADPDILIYGFTDVNIINSREQHMREIAKVITSLPKEKFDSAMGTADFRHDLAIRALKKGKDYWFYVANPGCWPVKGKVILSGKSTVVTPCDGQPVVTTEEEGKTVVQITLKPYGIVAFRAVGDVVVANWSASPSDDTAIKHMRGIIKAVNEIMDDPKAVLAITLEDRNFMREVMKKAEDFLKDGEFAAAWSELTNWRFWGLWKQQLIPAREFSARLAGRPVMASKADSGEHSELKVVDLGNGVKPVIDGNLDDAAWKVASAGYLYFSLSGQSEYLGLPVVDTSVQACHDSENLYIALRMADPDLKALRKMASPDNPVEVLRKYDDTVVMFINTKDNSVRQFAVNAGGVKYFAGSGGWGVDKDDLRGAEWKVATGVGTGEWVAEAAIPFSSLEVSAPKTGDIWRANFLRRFREFQIPESYWAMVKNGWGDAERYGSLKFE